MAWGQLVKRKDYFTIRTLFKIIDIIKFTDLETDLICTQMNVIQCNLKVFV